MKNDTIKENDIEHQYGHKHCIIYMSKLIATLCSDFCDLDIVLLYLFPGPLRIRCGSLATVQDRQS